MLIEKEPKFLHFQELVDQARLMIQTYCPEWTEYNLSDPGITLIELFAFMTTQLNYRLKRVPERNYLKFLEIIGVTPKPPKSAKTDLTFELAIPFPLVRSNGALDYTINTTIQTNTQVATRRLTRDEEEFIFITQVKRIVRPPKLTEIHQEFVGQETSFKNNNYAIEQQTKEGDIYKLRAGGFKAFQQIPRDGDAFYLGFEQEMSIAGYVLRLDLECDSEEGLGTSVYEPPLVWECGMGEGEDWTTIEPEEDTTHGLTSNGHIKLHLPVDMRPIPVHGIETYWLRCRFQPKSTAQAYASPPHINALKIFVTGITVPALHSAPVDGKTLGQSNGESNQQFHLRRTPVLSFDPEREEYLEVEEEQPDGTTRFIRWEKRLNFSGSDRYARHFILEEKTGLIRFGPAVRQPDGEVRQCGAIPKLGRHIRVSRYRTGGGAKGNVPAGSLRVLKQPISYVVEVTNRNRATGGRDAENLEAAKLRAQEFLRGQQRAVTAADYEHFCRLSGWVLRVKCIEPSITRKDPEPGWVKLLVVPQTLPFTNDKTNVPETFQPHLLGSVESARELLAGLRVDRKMKQTLKEYLDQYRVLGAALDISAPIYYGIKITATVCCKFGREQKKIRQAVINTLAEFMTPVGRIEKPRRSDQEILPSMARRQNDVAKAAGAWPFGQYLYKSDIYARIQAIEGVEYIKDVTVSYCCISPDQLTEKLEEYSWSDAGDEVRVSDDGLVCLVDADDIKVEFVDKPA